jgi:IclR family transcriptional regulator, KDG regulon repressor
LDIENVTAGKSIFRAVKIITSISQGVVSVTDIAEACNLNKATVSRLLKVLENTDLVKKDPISHQYMIGSLFTQFISAPLLAHGFLIRCANKEMRHLADETQETVHLDILRGISVFKLKSIPSTHVLRIVEENQESDDLHVGSTGKVLLSQLNNKDMRIALKHANLTAYTENTITHVEELMLQIKRIREQGYGISCGERIEGVVSISTPISDYVVPAAISILGPQDRLKPRINSILSEMKNSCTNISETLRETSG